MFLNKLIPSHILSNLYTRGSLRATQEDLTFSLKKQANECQHYQSAVGQYKKFPLIEIPEKQALSQYKFYPDNGV